MPACPSSAPPPSVPAASPADIQRWLAELGIEPGQRLERDGIASWDLTLDGRRRFDVRVTVILDPALALVAWVHYAPPLSDSLRKTYRRLLRWNDTFPFAKFAIAEDERPILETEIPIRWLDVDELGLALARLLAICDLLLEESAGLIWIGGRIPSTGGRPGRNEELLRRYGDQLTELAPA